MWKLLVLTALVCAVSAQRPGGGGMVSLEQNLTAVWERLHEIEDGGSCSPQITMHVHGPHGRGGGRHGRAHGHHSGSEEDGEDHEDDGSEEHGHRGHHDDGSAHVHIHLHADGGKGGDRDLYHRNPLPWAHQVVEHSVHAVCHMQSGTHDITGEIHLKQDFVGGEPTEVHFDLAGFNAEVHEHNFFVHRFGCLTEACAHVGAVFTPPHGRPGGHGGHHSEEHDEPDVEEAQARKRRSHHGHHDGPREDRTEGVIGSLACDENGEMHQEIFSDAITLIGLHNIAGRTIAIHQADDTEGTGEPLACCIVGWNDGSEFGDEFIPWLPQEREAAAQGEAHGH